MISKIHVFNMRLKFYLKIHISKIIIQVTWFIIYIHIITTIYN